MTSSLDACLASAAATLAGAGIPADEAGRDAELLARHLLGWNRADVLVRRRDPVPPDFPARYRPLVDRRAGREPMAYILGRQEFRGLEFEVTPDVLIPRPETELVVEEALAFAAGRPVRVADVGTGSGCIAIALAREAPSARITAIDRSSAALRVARRNATRHGVALALVQADLLEGVASFDLIVSNPPYVPERDKDTLQPEVAVHDPAAALFAGPDGGAVLQRLFETTPAHLAAGGRLVVEFGFGQEPWIQSAAAAAGWRIERVRRDLQSIPRVAVLRR